MKKTFGTAMMKKILALRARFPRDDRGIAAVEFALLLPLMLMIYLGLVELSRGMRAAQKLDYVSHTLADLTAQILPTSKTPTSQCTSTGAACINEDDVDNIFSAALTIMSGINDPSIATKLKMTISEVNITGEPITTPTTWKARTAWSVSRNGATKRPCGTDLTPDANPTPADVNKIASSYVSVTNGVAPTVGPIIIADITYDYSPGLSFQLFKWSTPLTYNLKRTSYAAVRNTFVPSHILYYMTSGTNCNAAP